MLKRDGILMLRGAVSALLLMLLLSLIAGLSLYAVLTGAREGKSPIRVALVDQEDSLTSRMATGMIRRQEFVSSYISFEDADEEEAVRGVAEGRFAAAVILPEGFLGKILHGQEGEAWVVLSESASSMAGLVGELARFGGRMLTAGQYGVFAGQEVLWAKGLSDEWEASFLVKGNADLLDYAVDVFTAGFRLERMTFEGTDLDPVPFFAVCWLTLVMILCGSFFSGLYRTDTNRPVLSRLYALRITPAEYLAGKILYPFLFRLVFLAAAAAGLSALTEVRFTAGGIASAVLGLLLVSVWTGSVGVLFSEKGGFGGIFFAAGALGIFLCGGLVPRHMLPPFLRILGEMTPSGALAGFLGPLFGDRLRLLPLLSALVYTVVLGAAVLRYLRRIPGKEGGRG